MNPVHRKVTKIGNSLGITLNKELLSKVNLDQGDDVEVTVREDTGEIILRKTPKVPSCLDPQFFDVLKTNVDKYRKTLEGLKDR